MTEHATYFEKADHCTFPLFEKQQIIIVASEMKKVIICINDFLFHLSDLVRGTQREYSSKPLKHSIAKCILVFKR